MFGLSKAHARQRLEALDTIGVNIMIADAELNIIYMNDAVSELLKEAESDLKKELPRFDHGRLIGSNIDIFHKNPAHQRGMLTRLQKTHKATIRVGTRAFDLVVNPLKQGGKVTGFVVEWADSSERLQNIDFQNQLEAIGRAQAVIAFSPEGEVLSANENFCKALGYSLGEIKGKHHSMFVDKAYSNSSEYKEFWNQLRAGKFQAAEFVRYGKNGRKVVINASYNPVFDEHGKVSKVVKFATDVTQRVHAVDTIGHGLTRMASGDLSFKIDEAFAPDFEALRNNFNEAIEQLHSTLSAVSSSADQLEGGSHEVRRGAEDLSKRTEQQAANLEETAAALDEITVNVKQTSARAEEARQSSATADQNASRSGEIVAEAVGAMARIETSSGQISNIIGVIDDIAFQTNLLALNAGVEAARAGDAGKGFAVVAQEVRQLAQRSADAAREIKDLISASSSEVQSGVKLVSQTGEALKAIQENIAIVNEHVQAIAGAAREQSTGLSEVNSAINQMDQTTQQNAAMVEQSTAASATLAQETDQLRNLISRFTLSAGAVSRSRMVAPKAAPVAARPAASAAPAKSRPAPAASQARAMPAVAGNIALKQDDWEEF